jgi:hypothetical protein
VPPRIADFCVSQRHVHSESRHAANRVTHLPDQTLDNEALPRTVAETGKNLARHFPETDTVDMRDFLIRSAKWRPRVVLKYREPESCLRRVLPHPRQR